jgi:hypothetical protein
MHHAEDAEERSGGEKKGRHHAEDAGERTGGRRIMRRPQEKAVAENASRGGR